MVRRRGGEKCFSELMKRSAEQVFDDHADRITANEIFLTCLQERR
jgi:hypothetical protein